MCEHSLLCGWCLMHCDWLVSCQVDNSTHSRRVLQMRLALEHTRTPAKDGGPNLEAGWHGLLIARSMGVKLAVFVVPTTEQFKRREDGWCQYTCNTRIQQPAERAANLECAIACC